MAANDIILFRKGSDSQWISANPVLASGEPGYDLTNKIFKIGDGVSNWISLSGHSHTSSNITDFNSSVSGLLPVTNIVAGSGITVSSSGGSFTINSSGAGGSGSVDVYEFATTANFPVTGTASVIYIATDSGRTYRWATPYYVEIGPIGGGDSRFDLFKPAAPTSVSGISGDTQVTVAWTSPVSVPPIIDYVVQYSSNSGSTWTTFSDGVSTSQSATVTGLTNGTSYVFRVSAINAIGTGVFSTTSSAVVAGSDSFFNNVSLLLNMDGESSTFIDSSPRQKTLTTVGSASQSATQSKWGGKSGYFAGDGTRLTIPDNDDFYFGSGDYVVEAWLYISTLNTSGGGNIFSQSANLADNSNRQYAFSVNSSGLTVYYTTNGSTDNSITFTTTPPTNQWFHVAFSRSNLLLRAYLNGARIGEPVSHNVTYYNSSANVCVGSFGGYAVDGYSYLDFTGFIDDLRVTKNSDRGYTGSTITVPTGPFPTF